MFRTLIWFACFNISVARLTLDGSKHVRVNEVQLGTSAHIQCNLLSSEDVNSNQIKVITWYKESYKLPIYRSNMLNTAEYDLKYFFIYLESITYLIQNQFTGVQDLIATWPLHLLVTVLILLSRTLE
jgi:hypothetical protein